MCIRDSANTVYEALATLPEQVRESWFGFDHFYSDNSFQTVLPHIFSEAVASVLDVGANTGKWALACAEYDPQVQVTLCDLPGQLAQARVKIAQRGFAARVHEHPINILQPCLLYTSTVARPPVDHGAAGTPATATGRCLGQRSAGRVVWPDGCPAFG